MIGYEGEWCCCYWWFTGWCHLSFGVHVHLCAPNLEIHLPFGFVRVGHVTDPVPIGEVQ